MDDEIAEICLGPSEVARFALFAAKLASGRNAGWRDELIELIRLNPAIGMHLGARIFWGFRNANEALAAGRTLAEVEELDHEVVKWLRPT